jgi:hypothetical protein
MPPAMRASLPLVVARLERLPTSGLRAAVLGAFLESCERELLNGTRVL